MKLIIELEKNSREVDWNASVSVEGREFVDVAATPEQAVANLLAVAEVQEALKKAGY